MLLYLLYFHTNTMKPMFSSERRAGAFALALFGLSALQAAVMLSGPVQASISAEASSSGMPAKEMRMMPAPGMEGGMMPQTQMRTAAPGVMQREGGNIPQPGSQGGMTERGNGGQNGREQGGDLRNRCETLKQQLEQQLQAAKDQAQQRHDEAAARLKAQLESVLARYQTAYDERMARIETLCSGSASARQ